MEGFVGRWRGQRQDRVRKEIQRCGRKIIQRCEDEESRKWKLLVEGVQEDRTERVTGKIMVQKGEEKEV